MSNKIFKQTSGLVPGRSVFDLSYSKLLTCDFGQLVPVMADEVYPGDKFKIGTEMVVRMQPLVAPVMHEIHATVHYFFVPNRLLWSDWEDFITGGENGQFDEDAHPLPRWEPASTVVGSLWDMFGFPVGVDPVGAYPVQFPLNAYNKIWNDYYRDENVMSEVALNQETVLKRSWAKDYFASALPWQQRGIAPALPISGITSAVFDGNIDALIYPNSGLGTSTKVLRVTASGNPTGVINKQDASNFTTLEDIKARVLKTALDGNEIDFSDAATFNVADLRLAFQIQKWMERNARAGARYVESVKAHFNVFTGDARLQRAEYIGGVKFPVVVSEVLQTSESTAESPQANMAGRGLSAGSSYAGDIFVKEHGWIIGVLSIMPVPMYMQGIDRQFLRRSRYDYYTPEFANLSEQAIERAEIYANGVEVDNRTIFGYQGRFDEMRTKRNMITGLLRTDLDFWHLARDFSAYPELNSAFLQMDATTGGANNPFKRIFAVPSEPGFIIHMANVIKAIRPMPIASNPGLIDHM